jgi:ABC-2 type transport system permease protein
VSVYAHRRTESPQQAARWDRSRQIAVNLRSIWGRAYPRVIGTSREPSWLFFEIALPFLTTSAFVFVYRALKAPPEFIGFVVLGGAMLAFWLNVIWLMAAQLYWEKDQGNLELYFTAPISLMSILFGMAMGGMLMSCLRAGVVLVVGSLLYGVVFSVGQWALLLGVFFLTLGALYGLGMMLSGLFLLWGREAWHMTQLLQEPVYFISGLNFPVARLGMLGALAVSTLPLAVGLDAMRQLAFAGSTQPAGFVSPEIEALVLVAMVVLFIGLARTLLRVIERRARLEGTLSTRGG